ncbi:C4-dicarboxylate ABC transporter substrate-binding protein [Colwellia hornerae]|uniref:C4-dicarboxylate ABC transporter substrate-binding protein n=1 Tax=Colwellia hornerae TaxID=89402 RepID=A0A5C6QNJ9_9GAMM|nr:C4-dicarboxylate ABC transporter substrate-binding protein [Colwellia hornerae]TWX60387.1 C4-dicarboxylate ABC transporter substrate-binding protein [Colwellia hornerae]TWX70142.1 C4-dicarboxylate ABC transporter substrate-binding protein [Colwellia hornerae]
MSALPADAATVLTYGEPGPNRGARAGATKWFAQEVEKRSGGDLKIDIMWGGALFKANASRQSIAAGVVDMGTIIQDYFPKEMVSFSLTNLPFENLDPWVGLKASYDHMKSAEVSDNLAKQNLAFVTSYMLSSVILICKGDAVRSLDDLQGKKIRGVGTFGKIFGDLGANLVSMSIYKAYQGLGNGLLDCSQGYMDATIALKQHEAADSLTKLNWGIYTGLGIFINQNSLMKLSPSQRKVLDEVAVDFLNHLGKNVIISDNKAEQLLTQGIDGHHMEMISLSPADSKKLHAASQSHIIKWQREAIKSDLDGKGMIEKYKKFLTKYSQERDRQGYPWTR